MNKLFKLKIIILICSILFLYALCLTTPEYTAFAQASTKSIKFDGHKGSRVAIPLSGPLNIGSGDFTIEWWMKPLGATAGAPCSSGVDVFTNGALIIDRDIYGPGDYGDYGLSLMSDRKVAFSVHNGSTGVTACSSVLQLNTWYYIAAVRQGNQIRLYVNGVLAETKSLSGNLSYKLGRSTSYTADPYLVLGAEKHTSIGGESFTAYHYNGLMDELRISNIARSISPTSTPFSEDGNTVALFRFEDNANSSVGSYSPNAQGVSFSNDVPFAAPVTTQPTTNPTNTPTTTPTATATSRPTTTPTSRSTVQSTSGPTNNTVSPTNSPIADSTQSTSPTQTPDNTVDITRVPQDLPDESTTTSSESSPAEITPSEEEVYSSQSDKVDVFSILLALSGFLMLVLILLFVLYKYKKGLILRKNK